MVCGDLKRTRLDKIKVLFFLGVSQGVVPADHSKGGLFTDNEREILKKNSMELAPTAREEGFMERFLPLSHDDEAVGSADLILPDGDGGGKTDTAVRNYRGDEKTVPEPLYPGDGSGKTTGCFCDGGRKSHTFLASGAGPADGSGE